MQKLMSLLFLFSFLGAMEKNETNKLAPLKDRIGEFRFNALKKAWKDDLNDLIMQMKHISNRSAWYYYSQNVHAYISYENNRCYIRTIDPEPFRQEHLTLESGEFFKELKPSACFENKRCIMS